MHQDSTLLFIDIAFGFILVKLLKDKCPLKNLLKTRCPKEITTLGMLFFFLKKKAEIHTSPLFFSKSPINEHPALERALCHHTMYFNILINHLFNACDPNSLLSQYTAYVKCKYIKKGNHVVTCSSVQSDNMYQALHPATMFNN